MNTPTRSAPHICLKVRPKTAGMTVAQLGRTTIAAKMQIRIQETRIDVPATPGAQLNATDPALWLIEETKPAVSLKATYFGRPDHGPVQSATTITRMMKGASPSHTSRLATCGVDAPLGVRPRCLTTGVRP